MLHRMDLTQAMAGLLLLTVLQAPLLLMPEEGVVVPGLGPAVVVLTVLEFLVQEGEQEQVTAVPFQIARVLMLLLQTEVLEAGAVPTLHPAVALVVLAS